MDATTNAGPNGCVVVFGDPMTPELARALDLAGTKWIEVASADDATDREPLEGWLGAVIDCSGDTDTGWTVARAMRKRELDAMLILVRGNQLADLALRDELFDDFCLTPFHPAEFEARLRHLLVQRGGDLRPELVTYGELELNLENYQASIDGRPLDLTFMEYELLKFLAQNPGKVFTREILLSRVWGYEYFGGARTVDVHVRRLRAKLSEEHAGLIQTVRSVGYRFGQSRWGS
jgi:DNA-binding response OmpR family regulator